MTSRGLTQSPWAPDKRFEERGDSAPARGGYRLLGRGRPGLHPRTVRVRHCLARDVAAGCTSEELPGGGGPVKTYPVYAHAGHLPQRVLKSRYGCWMAISPNGHQPLPVAFRTWTKHRHWEEVDD
jgi:hypothetical protein